MKIVIFGAGKVGRALIKTLEGRKHDIVVVDNNREICDNVASKSNVNVVCGDVADPDLLEELKVGNADYVFAVTGSEETNFLVSVYAKNVNAKRVISRATEMKYSHLMERLGVHPLVPEQTLARELGNMVLSPLISQMLDPAESSIEMLEEEVEGWMKEKTVEQVSQKHNFTIISVYDNGKFLFPSLDFVLRKGMRLIIVKHNI
ncbi:TrkA family potassium uptake protein [Candidatus Micrarchaeota archaeon]|nr:TrkA family potassium uptake protein [Candidatus Micrarchaeota archaeon]MBU1165357.1 TrkA family potassium uptake protein [Candidatus Micrarchaeota archaeon]MBU1886481.1 TrkA family potassium uptake protein [Candidatus Micrarchaeota archaeon]